MSLNSNTLPVVNEVKDVGVIVDSNLRFTLTFIRLLHVLLFART